MSDISKFKVGNDTYNIKDEESRNMMAETVLSTDNVPFVSKTMGTGKYQRKKFVGCSFVWNNLVNITSSSLPTTRNGITLSTDDNGKTLTVNGTATEYTTFSGWFELYRNRAFSVDKANHVYIVVMSYISGTADNTDGVYFIYTSSLNAKATTKINQPSLLKLTNVETTSRQADFAISSGTTFTDFKIAFFCVDLTQLFGSTSISDYIWTLTSSNALAKLKELGFFTEDYYAYDAGSIQSVDIKEYAVVDGFNLWDEQWELGYYGTSSGEPRTATTEIRSKNPIPVEPNTQYYYRRSSGSGGDVIYFDKNKVYISSTTSAGNKTFTTPANCYFIKLNMGNTYGTTYNNDICINLSDPTRNGQYEPYHKTTYPLTPTELRGVPKIDANNNIYCDGDEYASDGEVTRKYGIVDLGTLDWDYAGSTVQRFQTTLSAIKLTGDNGAPVNAICTKYVVKTWIDVANDGETGIACNGTSPFLAVVDSAYTSAEDFKAAMSGQYLVYEKATPTTETLTPFDFPQAVGSIEEITDYKVEQEERDVAIPTGHVTEYMGKGGEFTLPTLPETPSVLAYDGHNAYWEENTIKLVKAFMNENRRTRRDITNDLANLSQAVAEQNLGKYGYSIGDYFTGASGYTYILADYNTFRGTAASYCINANHLGIVVDTHARSQWHSENAASVGYNGSVLHNYLKTTVLDTIKTDFIALFGGSTGLEHLYYHTKLLTTAVANWDWQSDQYISALTCTQVDAGSQLTANGFQEGEASKSLELFREYKWTEVFGYEYPWLRNISNRDNSSASVACCVSGYGFLDDLSVTQNAHAVGLIIFA